MYHYVNPINTKKRRRQMQILMALCLVLLIACVSLFIAYQRASQESRAAGEMLVAKMQTEASNARSRAYSLSQTSGSSATALIAATRQHIYAMRVINELTAGIYGAGRYLIDPDQITACITLLDECDTKQAAGLVLTTTYTNLRSAVEVLYESAENLN